MHKPVMNYEKKARIYKSVHYIQGIGRKPIRVVYAPLNRAQKAKLIEYYVNHPDITMRALAVIFKTNEWTASTIITKDYFGVKTNNPVIITRQSKINDLQPELIEL